MELRRALATTATIPELVAKVTAENGADVDWSQVLEETNGVSTPRLMTLLWVATEREEDLTLPHAPPTTDPR